MEKRYTIKQSCAILDIDPTTLLRWCKIYTIEKAQIRSDRRVRLLTERQLRELADEHGVAFSEERLPLARHKPAYQTILEELHDLRARIADLEQRRTTAVPRAVLPSVPPAPPDRDAIPHGYIGWQMMARIHGIPKTTAERSVRRGDERRLPTVAGAWQDGATHYKEMLDDAGQRRFYELFRTHPRFTPCPRCPH